MLSRFVTCQWLGPRVITSGVRVLSTQTPKVPPGREILHVKEGPERDLINFPRLKHPVHSGKVRIGFLPDEWFQALYPKTGVTGPYVLFTGVLTFLYGKEWLVMDHEFYVGICTIMMGYGIYKKYGDQIAEYIDKGVDEESRALAQGRIDTLNALRESIKAEERAQYEAGSYKYLIEAKKENIALQLEAEFRRRQMEVYSEVKKRLDYQLETINIQRRLQQKHMVEWIVNNVLKSITARQEKEMLSKCISDLKQLSAAA